MKYSKIKKRLMAVIVSAIYILGIIAVGMIETSGTKASDFEGDYIAEWQPVTESKPVSAIRKPDYWYVRVGAAVQTVEAVEEPAYENIGEYTLTAYCPCVKCCGTWSEEHPSRVGTDYVQKTASGTIPEAGRTVGANTSILPFGTVLLINDAEYVVEDTGGAARNMYLIDIYFDTHENAVEFGRQKAEIYIKNE